MTKLVKIILHTIVFCSTSATHLVLAQNFQSCIERSSSAMEQTFCEIKKRDPRAQLPSFEDFRKNTPKVQRLLLKRDAERLGITLPRSLKNTSKKPETNITKPSQIASDTTEKLRGCTFGGDHIVCKVKRYQLVHNLKNSQLKSQAFSPQNELRFPQKSAPEFSDESDFRYLSAIYPNYIYKMLELGLGDSTMSFTKFATIYWQAKKDQTNFVERFRRVYNQLKTEKSRNQIKSRYNSKLPENIADCVQMDSKIIICDNAKQNWLYKLL